MIIIVPLIFLTISTSIGKMKSPKRVGKILLSIIGVFIMYIKNIMLVNYRNYENLQIKLNENVKYQLQICDSYKESSKDFYTYSLKLDRKLNKFI